MIREQSRSADSPFGARSNEQQVSALSCPACRVTIRQRVAGQQWSVGEARDGNHHIPMAIMRERKACDRADAPAQLVDERELRQPPVILEVS